MSSRRLLISLGLFFASYSLALQGQNTFLQEVRLDPSAKKADAADARKALQAGTAIIRVDGGTRADVRRLLGVEVQAVTASTQVSDVVPTTDSGQAPKAVVGTRSAYKGFAVYKDADGSLRSAQIYGSPNVPQKRFEDDLTRWVTQEQGRAAGLLVGDPEPPAQAWTKLYSGTFINSGDGGTETNTVSIWRLNSTDAAQDYYMVYSIPQATPNWNNNCNHFSQCDPHTVSREFWTGAISGGTLNDHGPTSTVGTSTAGFSIGANVGPTGGGVSAGFSATWSQPDVVTSDRSNSTQGHWFENWNFNNYYAYCNPLAGAGPPNSSTNTFFSRHGAIFVVPGGTPSVTFPLNDTTNFCSYSLENNNGFGGASYSTLTTSWQVTLSPPLLSASPAKLTVPAGGTELLLVTAIIPNSSQGLVWQITSNLSDPWLTVPSSGPFSSGQAIPVSVKPGTPDGTTSTLSLNTVPPFAAPSVETGPIQVTVTVGQPATVERAGVLLAGGANDGSLSTSTFYDFQAKQQIPIGQMQTKRIGHTATRLLNGDVLIVGGATELDGIPGTPPVPVTGTAEIFHPSTLSFTSTGSLATPRRNHQATLLPDGKVLVTSGDAGNASVQLAELWDPTTGTFSSAGSTDSDAHSRSAVLVSAPGSPTQVLVFGGNLLNEQPATTTSLWSEATNSFTSGPAMRTTQSSFPQPVKNNFGQYEIVGGLPQQITPSINSEQLLDPLSLSFTTGSGMVRARTGHTLTALAGTNGLMVTGGDSQHPATVEIKRSTDSTWSVLSGSSTCPGASGCMTTDRVAHTATLLPDGTVLIAGGIGTNGSALASTEIFDPSKGQFTAGILLTPQFSQTATFVSQSNATLLVSPSTAELGQPITLVANVHVGAGSPIGTVTFLDGQTAINTVNVQGTTATLTTTKLNIGTHSLSAVYNGDVINAPSVSPVVQVAVKPITTTVTLGSNNNPSGVGRPVRITATVNPASTGPTGTVTFKDGDTVLATLPLSGSAASYSTSTLSSGAHSITAVYNGDPEYSASTSSSLEQVVSEQSTTTALTATPSSTNFGAAVTFVASITGTRPITGSVSFLDNATPLGSVQVAGARATLSISTLAAGLHTIRASYTGDATHAASVSAPAAVTVAQAQPSITIASSANPSNTGQPVTFTARIRGATGATVPTGTVTFSDGVNQIGQPQTVFNGTATISRSNLIVGTHAIYASYSGDANYSSASSTGLSQVVLGAATKTAVASSPNPSTYGQTVTFLISVIATTGTPTGTITIREGVAALGTVLVNNGTALFTTSVLTPGTHNILAVYGGDANFAASTSTALIQTVRRTATTTVLTASSNTPFLGQRVTLTATVGGSSPTGSIRINEGGRVLGLSTVTNGRATIALPRLGLGTHTLIATYSGDSNNLTSTSSPNQLVVRQRLTPTFTLTSSPNPSIAGNTVTFVLTASGTEGTPTGSVTLLDGLRAIGSLRPLTNGKATFQVSTLTSGTRHIYAIYDGDSTYAVATSPSLIQQVNVITPVTISMTSTPNPSLDGRAVLLTIQVRGTDGSLPAGSVTLSEGQVVYGSGTLVQGRAFVSTSKLLVGIHELRATYGGDTTHQSGTSGIVQQRVNLQR